MARTKMILRIVADQKRQAAREEVRGRSSEIKRFLAQQRNIAVKKMA